MNVTVQINFSNQHSLQFTSAEKNVSVDSLKVDLILIFFKYVFFRNQILKSHTSQSMRGIALHTVTKTLLHSVIILGQKKGTWRRTSQN